MNQRLTRTFGSTTSYAVTIDALPEVVWAFYTDVERWPRWTASVTSARLDPTGPLQLGSLASIKQPRLPGVVWIVTELTSNQTWTWQNLSPGADTVARHTLTPTVDGRTHVDLYIDQRGVIGRPLGWILRGLTRRYLRLEAEGLRRRSEAFEASDS